eukprot:7079864-Prorocentrum_lima.AAC.1
MSVVVNVQLRPLLILGIILKRPMSTLCVHVGSHQAWFSDAEVPPNDHSTLGLPNLRNVLTKTVLQ